MVLEYENVNDNLIKYKSLFCNKNYSKKIDENLKRWFKNKCKFSNNDNNTFILLLRKVVHPYEYMDDWEKFNETALSKKEEFYNNLNVEDVTDSDYNHTKRICKYFEIKQLSKYYDLILKSDTLILSDVFENFRKMRLEIHELDLAKFLPPPGLARQAALKKTKKELKLLTEIDILLIVEKRIRREILIDMQRLIINV